MRYRFTFWAIALGLFVILSHITFAEVVGYRGSAFFNPRNRFVRAELILDIKSGPDALKELRFKLNSNLKIVALDCPLCAGFETLPAEDTSYTKDLSVLTVKLRKPLAAGQSMPLHVRYAGVIPRDNQSNLFTPDWTELSLYDCWFPWDNQSLRFHYDLKVNLPPDNQLIGSEKISGGKGHWRIQQVSPTLDIVILASPRLITQQTKTDGLTVTVASADFTSQEMTGVAEETHRIVSLYSKWYGGSQGKLTIVFSPVKNHGGYSRTGLISIKSSSYRNWAHDDYQRLLAHEIAHLWWNKGPLGTWEDWLNESFAEYSAWCYMREASGDEAFQKRLEKARKRAAGKPPLIGMPRNSADAEAVLYAKQPLALNWLETQMGTQSFEQFLRQVNLRSIANTHSLLNLLETTSSQNVRQNFEALMEK